MVDTLPLVIDSVLDLHVIWCLGSFLYSSAFVLITRSHYL
jgi:hypothetical protein